MVTKAPARENRFKRHKKKTSVGVVIALLLLMELSCYIVIATVGHREKRGEYPYNRVLSGYTVYRQTPGFDFGDSTIKSAPDDPDVVLDANGFISDSEVKTQKSKNVVRVFLMGGSTVIGAGQTDGYQSVHKYQWGIYSYRASIAGKLKAWLESRFPAIRFEVVTAASYGRKLHQSCVDYMALISHFSPDVVISFDGMNDLVTFDSGTPYSDTEAAITDYVDLWNDHHRKSLIARTSTYYVLQRLARRLQIESLGADKQVVQPPPLAESEEEYRKNRDRFIQNAARFLQILQHFRAAVESDGATFVFGLQPLLHRRGKNKQLSAIESELDRVMLVPGFGHQQAARVRQINRYFFDDYLCDQIRTTLDDGGFVDVNAHLLDLDAGTEFYTDYCHLTEEGNRITAEILGRHLAFQLHSTWDAREDETWVEEEGNRISEVISEHSPDRW